MKWIVTCKGSGQTVRVEEECEACGRLSPAIPPGQFQYQQTSAVPKRRTYIEMRYRHPGKIPLSKKPVKRLSVTARTKHAARRTQEEPRHQHAAVVVREALHYGNEAKTEDTYRY